MPGVFQITRLFFWTLSSTRPSPVSSTASSEIVRTLAARVSRTEVRMRLRVSSGVLS